MADEQKFEELPEGVADPRLNGMTSEQFRCMVTAFEAQLAGMLQGNNALIVTLLLELQTRMVLDFDEIEKGDDLLGAFHAGLDRTVAAWRASVKKSRVEHNKGLH